MSNKFDQFIQLYLEEVPYASKKELKEEYGHFKKQFVSMYGGAGDDDDKFICPITHARMRYPCVAADGNSYECSAIIQWLNQSDRSPMTNVRLRSRQIFPNITLRSEIQEWERTHPAAAANAAAAAQQPNGWQLLDAYNLQFAVAAPAAPVAELARGHPIVALATRRIYDEPAERVDFASPAEVLKSSLFIVIILILFTVWYRIGAQHFMSSPEYYNGGSRGGAVDMLLEAVQKVNLDGNKLFMKAMIDLSNLLRKDNLGLDKKEAQYIADGLDYIIDHPKNVKEQLIKLFKPFGAISEKEYGMVKEILKNNKDIELNVMKMLKN